MKVPKTLIVAALSLALIAVPLDSAAAATPTGNWFISSGSGAVVRANFYQNFDGSGYQIQYRGSGNCTTTSADRDFTQGILRSDWNDAISAGNDYASCDVILYQNGGEGGASKYFNFGTGAGGGYVGSDWNDRASSFVIT